MKMKSARASTAAPKLGLTRRDAARKRGKRAEQATEENAEKPANARGRQRQSAWFLYVLRCHDQTLYCGIAVDVEKRLEQHRSGKGARYTRGRGPLTLVHVWKLANQSEALKAEWAFKKLSRAKKEKILKRPSEWLVSKRELTE